MKRTIYNREQLRIRAIELYNKKYKVSEICKNLKCSKRWLYKWVKRSKTDGSGHWYREHPRKPKTKKKKIDLLTEHLVLEARKELISSPYMQYGPQAIFFHLMMKDVIPPPSWAIARILKENKVTRKKRPDTYQTKGKKYPYEYTLCQQIDFVGPRHLNTNNGIVRYYFLNLICCDTHYAQISAYENHCSTNACNSLIEFWKTAGIPDFLQMDNDLCFWGSLNLPNALGKVIRLCLLHKVTPVFIPMGEPWRNGILEHFNNTMQAAVLNTRRYNNLQEVQEASKRFSEIHNKCHRYTSQDSMSAQQYRDYLKYPIVQLSEEYLLSKERIPLCEGEIHVIRFIRSDLKFNIFGLTFNLPEEIKYEYVIGKIITHEHKLKIYIEQKPIAEFRLNLY